MEPFSYLVTPFLWNVKENHSGKWTIIVLKSSIHVFWKYNLGQLSRNTDHLGVSLEGIGEAFGGV